MGLGLIWAQSTNGVIGADGSIPWHLPEDMAHFRRATEGHPVIMGRRTWESLPPKARPLPGRRNIVVSRTLDPADASGAEVVASLEEALAAVGDTDAWIIGGATLYEQAEPIADHAAVTEIDLDIDGDTHAPTLGAGWERAGASDWETSDSGPCFRFVGYVRR